MSNQVNNFIKNAKIISDEVEERFGSLSAEQLNWKPNADEWSVGQCFDHLITTNNLYFKHIQKVADGNHTNNWYSAIPFVPKLIGTMLKKMVSPDSPRKIKTFQVFEPTLSEISKKIIEEFCENNERLISLMEATMGLNLNKIKIPEPISIAVNVSLIDAYEILALHERRHFNQAKSVMQLEGFPT